MSSVFKILVHNATTRIVASGYCDDFGYDPSLHTIYAVTDEEKNSNKLDQLQKYHIYKNIDGTYTRMEHEGNLIWL